MGQIVGNDLCGLFHRRKTIARMRRHETDHAGDAARFHLRCDVDQRQRSETSRCAFSLGDDPGQATKRRANQRRFARRRRSDLDEIGRKIGDIIGSVAGPCTLAVPAHIDCDGPETMAREPVGYRPPCPSGLSAAVREDYR